MLTEALVLFQTVVLAATFPMAVVAARGYRGTPFGRFLRPLVAIPPAFVVAGAAELLVASETTRHAASLAANVVGLVAITWAVVQLVTVLTERRAV